MTRKFKKPAFLMYFTLIITLCFNINFLVSQESITKVFIDLNKASAEHKLNIEVFPPQLNTPSIKYFFPKIVPGTYTINNFGRFISDFKAYDSGGNELAVNRIDTNIWEIQNADKLVKITYTAEDTYNSESIPTVFEPTGTCIDSAKIFMLNNFTLTGYFDGYKDFPYTLTITKPIEFYGSTSLNLLSSDNYTDIYSAKNYFELHDNPLMYSIPDTASLMVNNTKVLLSIYSPNKKVTSSYLVKHTQDLFEAQGKYLGGNLPADKYSILVYLSDKPFRSRSAGALEHFSSTTFCYPETSNEEFLQPFRDVVAHEFFHIVTPLGIHSEEIGNFDFINPVMSKHLWLYEGSTEYYSVHAQVKYGLISMGKFFDKIRSKVIVSTLYLNDTLPFTELSKGALDKYKFQYYNVYQKGALINMCLDLYLLELSGGKYGLQNLKKELGEKFGPEKPFNDEELFDIIAAMTYPEIREFFRMYVEGGNKIPYKQFLGYAGIDFYDKKKVMVPVMIGATLELNESGEIKVLEVNEFGKKLNLKKGDLILSVNGFDINAHNFNYAAEYFEKNTKAGDEVTVTVSRGSKGSVSVNKVLKAKTYLVEKEKNSIILPAENPTEKQLMIRKAWLNQ